MLKRAISLSFLLLANMLLLAHLVIPHHHHEKTGMCFLRHCQDSNEAHHHQHQDTQAHQHEGNAASDKCSLDNAYAPANNHKKITGSAAHNKYDCSFLITNNLRIQEFLESTLKTFRLKPCVLSVYTDYIVQSLGLRAPPLR